jgi:hypothetical protein
MTRRHGLQRMGAWHFPANLGAYEQEKKTHERIIIAYVKLEAV